MKKLLRLGILCGALTLLLCVSALAVNQGVYEVSTETVAGHAITITPVDANGDTVAAAAKDDGLADAPATMADAERIKITYADASASTQYLLLLTTAELTGDVVPTSGNIQYINQDSLDAAGTLTFTAVPRELATGTYYVYLTSSGGKVKLGSFKYYRAYTLGDVDGVGGITTTDALWALQSYLETRSLNATQLLAANVDGNAGVTTTDALWILQRYLETRDANWVLK